MSRARRQWTGRVNAPCTVGLQRRINGWLDKWMTPSAKRDGHNTVVHCGCGPARRVETFLALVARSVQPRGLSKVVLAALQLPLALAFF